MTRLLETILGELGISQYLDVFLEQGFDTWETILDITESDLDALGVKLGHRRKLQRRIANYRGVAPQTSLVSAAQPSIDELKFQNAHKADLARLDGRETAGAVIVTKRKYRRHPKPDENAPERPPSAYVLFSNKMREELRGRNLTFTEIAKLVGENWQSLSPVEKEPFESQAQAMKDKYLSDLAEYKKTPEYRKYQVYLQEFKAKHASPSQDKDGSKRARLSDSGVQGRSSRSATPTKTSKSGSGAESHRGSEPPAGRLQRLGSAVSTSESQYSASLTSSASIASPGESVLNSPVVNSVERLSSDRSPTFSANPRDPPSPPGRRNFNHGNDPAPEHLNMQRNLPSISDVFDGRRFQEAVHPPSEANGFPFPAAHAFGSPGPSLRQTGGDVRPATLKGELTYSGSSSSSSSFVQVRTPVDGPLPIHALLAPKSEQDFEYSQPTHLFHGNPSPIDQNPLPAHHIPNGAGLPVINGYHTRPSLSHSSARAAHSAPSDFYTQASSQFMSPQRGKHDTGLDGMSALLKAGEIVDRRAQ
ncbi:hypothetical protein VTK56DRAFT_3537 [Thermocarpiscus australiensis]